MWSFRANRGMRRGYYLETRREERLWGSFGSTDFPTHGQTMLHFRTYGQTMLHFTVLGGGNLFAIYSDLR